MTDILIAKEKHGRRYFVIEDRAAHARVAAKLLKERAEEGWFSTLADIEAEEAQAIESRSKTIDRAFLELTDEQIAELPEALRESVISSRESYARIIGRVKREYALEKEFAEGISILLAADDPASVQVTSPRGRTDYLAIGLLQLREDYEYEGYSIEIAEEA